MERTQLVSRLADEDEFGGVFKEHSCDVVKTLPAGNEEWGLVSVQVVQWLVLGLAQHVLNNLQKPILGGPMYMCALILQVEILNCMTYYGLKHSTTVLAQ